MKMTALALAVGILFSTSASASQAEVRYVSTKDYVETALGLIHSAKKSVAVYMYLVSHDPSGAKTQPQQLLDALADAKRRGVDVEVVLDQNIDFTQDGPAPTSNKAKNIATYDFLKNNGIKVFYDGAAIYTHSKVLVVDNKTTLLGSTNWTNTGLARNVESNLLVESEEIARATLEDLKRVQRHEGNAEGLKPVSLSWVFTNRADLMGAMMEAADERAFDLYLYLLKIYDGNAQAKTVIDFDDAAKVLGIEKMPKEAYRRQLIKVAKKLESRYKLIEYQPRFGKNAEVILKSFEDPAKPYEYPQKGFLKIPGEYWAYGWNKTLSFPAKAVLLLNLSYAPISDNPPKWFGSRKVLSDRHHLTEFTITQGNTELRRKNIIEIEYSPHTADPASRQANTYRLNGLYDPKVLEAQREKLKSEYGEKSFARVEALVQSVYEDSDGIGMETILKAEALFGQEIVDEAARIVAEKNPDNPKRSMPYLIATIRSIGEAHDQKNQ